MGLFSASSTLELDAQFAMKKNLRNTALRYRIGKIFSRRSESSGFGFASAQSLALETLEVRYLLAGNMDVDSIGDGFKLSGDELANNVEISVVSGDIVLTGKDSTTINGSASPITLRTGSTQIDGSLIVHLFDGNDTFVIKGQIQIGDSLKIFAGAGNDTLGMENVSVQDDIFVFASDGNDQIAMRNSSVGGKFRVDLGDGDDTLSAQSITVGNQVSVTAGRGADAIVLEQMTINGPLLLNTGSGNDTVSVVGSTIRDKVVANTGLSDDFISIDASTIEGKLKVVGSRDDDSVVLSGSTSIGGRLVYVAGTGSDGFQSASTVTFGNSNGVQVNVENNTVPQSLITQRLNDPQFGANTRAEQARAAVGFPPPTPLQLTISTSSNTTVASRDTLLTKDSSFTITGNTLAGAQVEIARDGDSVFNDGSVIADASGNFSIDVTLTNTDQNRGESLIVVRATDSFSRTATQNSKVHFAVGTVVRMTSSLGFIDVELLDADAPTFVANFESYFPDYVNSIVHRLTRVASDGLGVIQGGGFVVAGSSVTAITTDPDIDNDFDPANLNIRGSLSMARLGGLPNSATSQWFINTTANTTLDTQEFTVFGHVIPSSLPIVDAIAALTEFNVALLTGATALTEVPLQGYATFSVSLAGTVATTAGSLSVTGTGTAFTSAIPTDKLIQIGGQSFIVDAVISDTQLTLTTAPAVTTATATVRVNALPNSTQYVTFSTVAELSGF